MSGNVCLTFRKEKCHKIKKHIFVTFHSFKIKMRFGASYKQDKIRFLNVFHIWKIKKNVFEAFFIFTKWTNIFLKRFHHVAPKSVIYSLKLLTGSIFLKEFLNNISDHDNFVSFGKRKYERMFWVPTFIPLGLRKIFYDDLKKKLLSFYV